MKAAVVSGCRSGVFRQPLGQLRIVFQLRQKLAALLRHLLDLLGRRARRSGAHECLTPLPQFLLRWPFRFDCTSRGASGLSTSKIFPGPLALGVKALNRRGVRENAVEHPAPKIPQLEFRARGQAEAVGIVDLKDGVFQFRAQLIQRVGRRKPEFHWGLLRLPARGIDDFGEIFPCALGIPAGADLNLEIRAWIVSLASKLVFNDKSFAPRYRTCGCDHGARARWHARSWSSPTSDHSGPRQKMAGLCFLRDFKILENRRVSARPQSRAGAPAPAWRCPPA